MPSAEEQKSAKRKIGAIGCSLLLALGVVLLLAAIALPKFGGFSRESRQRSLERHRAALARDAGSPEAPPAEARDAGPTP